MVFQGKKNLDAAEMLLPRLERRQTCLALLEPQLAMLPVDLLLSFDLINLCCQYLEVLTKIRILMYKLLI